MKAFLSSGATMEPKHVILCHFYLKATKVGAR